MHFGLDDEQQLLVSTIRRFVDKQIREWAADADRAGEPPGKLFQMARDVGFFTDAVPASADGLLEGDYPHVTRALRGLELGRGCAGLAALLETNVEPALAVSRWATPELATEVHAAQVAGKLATTWHDFSHRLTIRADGDTLVIDGPVGPAPVLAPASHLLLAAYVGDAGGDTSEPVLALIPTSLASIKPLTPSAWRAAAWASASFSAARIPVRSLLARGEAARAAISELLAWYKVSLAARAVGVATASMQHAKQYGEERIQFGKPIGEFESLARMRDDNETRIAAARLLVLEAAWQLDNRVPAAFDTASRARDLAAGVVSRATVDAVQIYGGYGFVNDFPVEKLMRDARAFDVLAGNESLSRIIGGGRQ